MCHLSRSVTFPYGFEHLSDQWCATSLEVLRFPMVLNTWQISDVHPKSIEIPCVLIISPPWGGYGNHFCIRVRRFEGFCWNVKKPGDFCDFGHTDRQRSCRAESAPSSRDAVSKSIPFIRASQLPPSLQFYFPNTFLHFSWVSWKSAKIQGKQRLSHIKKSHGFWEIIRIYNLFHLEKCDH